jgi:predicted alpha-1,6-mannanase (GH76 family)
VHPRWAERPAAVLDAIATRMAGPDGVLPGFDDGGDGGLFNGILARYLAHAAARRPELAPKAARLVFASADAAWLGRTEMAGGPVFAQDWRQPAHDPPTGFAVADLSVQLSAWMLLGSRGHRPVGVTSQRSRACGSCRHHPYAAPR